MPLRKVHELTFLWFGLPGPLLILLLGIESLEASKRADLFSAGASTCWCKTERLSHMPFGIQTQASVASPGGHIVEGGGNDKRR